MGATGHIEVRTLDVTLTPEERSNRSNEIVSSELEIERLNAQLDMLREQRKGLNDAVGDIRERIGELAHALHSGTEPRPVECEWTHDYDRKSATLKRVDTGIAVEVRALTAEEMQVVLPEIGELPAPTPRKRGKLAAVPAEVTHEYETPTRSGE